ncbi:MAG: YqeG family HAD IIIA-type phosphatase [Cyanobacteriota bacterium]|nr:YqeG family HAD IIIA-type phosphatase [Cyanobacteriota bacterium]
MLARELLIPDWMPGTTMAHLPLQTLLERGIRGLVLDVDRTLLPRRSTTLPEPVEQWLRHASDLVPIHLLSNNPSRQRIGAVARQLGVPYTTSAGKPRRSALRRVVEEMGLPAPQVALAGDRVFTDVLAGNRLGVYTVLVKPIDALGNPCQRDRLQHFELRMARWIGGAWG